MRPALALAVALASGVALSLAFPEPSIGFLAWLCLAPLLVMLRDAGPRRAAGLGFAFGAGFMGSLIVWISIVGWIAWFVLILLQASFFALFALCYSYVARRWGSVARTIAALATWVFIAEYVRSVVPVVGFTWGELAQSQHDYAWMLRPAALGGGWSVAALVVAVNSLVAESFSSWRDGRRGSALKGMLVLGGLLAVPLLLPENRAGGEPLTVAIVQGNIPRAMAPSYEKDQIIIDNHVSLTEALPDSTDLVVWPESSVGIDPERDIESGARVSEAARSAGAPMIVGGTSEVDDDHYLVMAFQVSPTGEIVDRYQKTHLVPFGEYVPARSSLDWLPMLAQVPRDAIAGNEPTIFDIDGAPVAAVISFEGDFGSLVRERIDLGGRLLVVATNTSTWEDSWASAQHVALSQVRAAENGVWVAHGALTGISAFIAPNGQVVERTDLWTSHSLVREIRLASSITIYARVGDWVPVLCGLLLIVIVLLSRKREPL